MKAKFVIISVVALLPLINSCSKTRESFNVPYSSPTIRMESAKGYSTIELKGRFYSNNSSYYIPGCEFFFLCSTDKDDFSNAVKIAASGSGQNFTAEYKPSASGTFYFRFCGDNNGLSYLQSEVLRCNFTIITLDGPVDLGLSVKWAACNLGAKSPEKYGGYYQWAGLQDVTSTSRNLSWSNCPYHTGSSEKTGWTKYNTISSYGKVDKKIVLELSDDVAHTQLSGKWRMPTDAEWTELRNNCTCTWTDDFNGTGIAGRIVTSKKTGYADKSIFLPAAGYRYSGYLKEVGSKGVYWSSSLNTDDPSRAYGVNFNSGNVDSGNCTRYYGRSVRAVLE